jgi:hypothetical protein
MNRFSCVENLLIFTLDLLDSFSRLACFYNEPTAIQARNSSCICAYSTIHCRYVPLKGSKPVRHIRDKMSRIKGTKLVIFSNLVFVIVGL